MGKWSPPLGNFGGWEHPSHVMVVMVRWCPSPAECTGKGLIMGSGTSGVRLPSNVLSQNLLPSRYSLGVEHPCSIIPSGYFPSCHGLVVALAEVHPAHPALRRNVLYSLGGSTLCPGYFPAILHGAGAILFILVAEELLHPVPHDGHQAFHPSGIVGSTSQIPADPVGGKKPQNSR